MSRRSNTKPSSSANSRRREKFLLGHSNIFNSWGFLFLWQVDYHVGDLVPEERPNINAHLIFTAMQQGFLVGNYPYPEIIWPKPEIQSQILMTVWWMGPVAILAKTSTCVHVFSQYMMCVQHTYKPLCQAVSPGASWDQEGSCCTP